MIQAGFILSPRACRGARRSCRRELSANRDGECSARSRCLDFGLRPSLDMTAELSPRACRGVPKVDQPEPVRTAPANLLQGRDLSTARLRRFAQGDSFAVIPSETKCSRGISTVQGAHRSETARRAIPDKAGVLRRRRAVRSHRGRRTAMNLVLRWLRTAETYCKGECSG